MTQTSIKTTAASVIPILGDLIDLHSKRQGEPGDKTMTHADFGKLIGMSPDAVSECLNKSVRELPMETVIKIAECLGQKVDEIIKYEKPTPIPLKPENTWDRHVEPFHKQFVNYSKTKPAAKPGEGGKTSYKKTEELLQQYGNILKHSKRKKRVSVIAGADVGKSKLINSSIGTNKSPEGWQPMTAMILLFKHVDDRPDFIKNECVVFKASEEDGSFNLDLLSDEIQLKERFEGLRVDEGGADILQEYGTRKGREASQKADIHEAAAAVVYVESEILKNCDLVDLPGFGSGGKQGEADDKAVKKATSKREQPTVDAIIFMARANAFFTYGLEIEYLKEAFLHLPEWRKVCDDDSVPRLENLFILASQAHTVNNGNRDELDDIMLTAYDRIIKAIPEKDEEFKACLESRFFTYTTNIEERRERFETEFTKFVEKLPYITLEETKRALRDNAEESVKTINADIKDFEDFRDRIEEKRKEYDKIAQSEPARKMNNNNQRISIGKQIESYKRASLFESELRFNKLITIENIVGIIKTGKFKKKKKDMELLGQHINGLISGEVTNVLLGNSARLSKVIDEYIINYGNSIKVNAKIPFNALRAFASGLAGAAVFGGLAVWAASLGNLAGYILIAKGVSLLSAIGITIKGGTAAAVAFVAGIGGPVTIAIALAMLAALGVFAVFSGGWEKRAAKQIIKSCRDEDVLNKIKTDIEKYWDDTCVAFNTAADAMEGKWQEHINNLKELIDGNLTEDEYNALIRNADKVKSFFSGIIRLLGQG